MEPVKKDEDVSDWSQSINPDWMTWKTNGIKGLEDVFKSLDPFSSLTIDVKCDLYATKDKDSYQFANVDKKCLKTHKEIEVGILYSITHQ